MYNFLYCICLLATIIVSVQSTTTLANSAELQIYFLDVGQGDATILHQPGSCTALIDAGPLLNGHRVTTKLQELGVTDLDLVIITHPHLDHFGGLFDLAPRVSINKFYDNGVDNQVPEYFDDYLTLRQRLPYMTLTQGDVIKCGLVTISVLHPNSGPSPESNLNETSLVLMISYRDFRLLHMGDLAGEAEKKFLKQVGDIKASAIKIAHHGAADATSSQLLTTAAPEFAIISTANENRINSPASVVLNRLSNQKITLYRTDRDGTIGLNISEKGWQISSH